MMILLEYLNNFWRTIEMPLINCEMNLQLQWSEKCILVTVTAANQVPVFEITDTKLYLPIVTLSTQDNVKLLRQIESGFKRTLNWNKYHFEKNQAQHRYLSFIVLSFENKVDCASYEKYYLPTTEIQNYNVMIDGKSFFDKTVKRNLKTYNNIREIATGQGDEYTPGCLIDYPYFEKYYKLITKDLIKQQKVYADPEATQHKFNF